jgi:mRNA interferase RelE/StbE
MFKIQFKASVAKDLKKVSKTEISKILSKIETDLPTKANSLPSLKGEFSGLKKYRIGDYCIIFCLPAEATILITRIGHRSDVYKNKG